MLKSVVMNTIGDGYWSEVAKAVTVTNMTLGYVSDDKDFGELCVYFDKRSWDVRKDGLIYTDSLFIGQLREFCNVQGLDGNDIDYSEQGMQGEDYVSLDVGKNFLASWAEKFKIELDSLVD